VSDIWRFRSSVVWYSMIQCCGVIQHDTVLFGKQSWCFTGLSCLYRQSQVGQSRYRHYSPARCWEPIIQQHSITFRRLEPSAIPLWEPQSHWLYTWWETHSMPYIRSLFCKRLYNLTLRMSEFGQLPTTHTHTHTQFYLFIYIFHICVCTVKPINSLPRYETESNNLKTLKMVVGTVME